MGDFGGVIIELLIFFGIPLLIPLCIFLLIEKFANNVKLRKITLFILSLIYNAIIGFISFLLFYCLIFLLSGVIFNMKIMLAIAIGVFSIILIPTNIFMMKKIKINYFLYIVLNIVIMVLSFMLFVSLFRGGVDL